MQMCEEMMKLRSGLDARKIPWIDASSVCSPEYIANMAARGFDPSSWLSSGAMIERLNLML